MTRYGGKTNLNSSGLGYCPLTVNVLANPGYGIKLVGGSPNPKNHDQWSYPTSMYVNEFTYECGLPSRDQRPGRWHAFLKGQGEFTINSITNVTRGPTVSSSPGRYICNSTGENTITFETTATGNQVFSNAFRILNTNADGVNYLRDFEIIHEDDLQYRGLRLWHPDLIAKVRKNNPRVWRNMNWSNAHGGWPCMPMQWSQRPRGRGAPYYADHFNNEAIFYLPTSYDASALYFNIPGWIDEPFATFVTVWPRAGTTGDQIVINGAAGLPIKRASFGNLSGGDLPGLGHYVALCRDTVAGGFICYSAKDDQAATGTLQPKLNQIASGCCGVEDTVAFCNEAGVDLWWCFHAHQLDMGPNGPAPIVRDTLIYIDQNLDPDLEAWIEPSNEMWNTNYMATLWAYQREAVRHPELAAAGNYIQPGWNQWMGRVTSQLGQLMEEVCPTRSRFKLTPGVWTASTPTVNQNYQGRFDSSVYVAENGGNTALAAKNFIDQAAPANYMYSARCYTDATPIPHQMARACLEKAIQFRDGTQAQKDAAIAWLLAGIYDSSLGFPDTVWPTKLSWIKKHNDACAAMGIPIVFYEGGHHFPIVATPASVFYETTLRTNPFTTTAGSNVVRVNWPGHGKTVYDPARPTLPTGKFAAYKGNASGDTPGNYTIPTFNGVDAATGEKNVTNVIDADNFEFVFSTSKTATASGVGGGAVSLGNHFRFDNGNGTYSEPTGALFNDFYIAAKMSDQIIPYLANVLADLDALSNASTPSEFNFLGSNSNWGDIEEGLWGVESGQFKAFTAYNNDGIIVDPGPVPTTFTFSIVP